MSDDTERIRACVTYDWQSTVQIMEKSGIRCTSRKCAICKVFRTLYSDYRYGLVEKQVVENVGRGGKATVWRLAE